jgi:hypothetical protein
VVTKCLHWPLDAKYGASQRFTLAAGKTQGP